MTFAVRLRPAAIADLDMIRDYIAQDSPEAADRTVAGIAKATGRLAHFPSSGTQRPDIHATARSIPVGACLILYRVADKAVEIVRILHGARDLPARSRDFIDDVSGAQQ